MARLGDVCTIYSGTGFPLQFQGVVSGTYPFYKVGDIAKNAIAGYKELKLCDNYIESDIVEQIKGTLIPPQTVVFAKIGEAVKLNRRAITSCDCLIDNNAMGIKPNEEVLFLPYFFYYMCSLHLEKYAEATTVPSVKKSVIDNLNIPLLSLVDQHHIAAVLDKVSDVIRLRKQQLAKLDELIKARFVEMFGDPVSNPKGWDKKALSEEAEIKIGPFGSLLHKEDYIGGGHPLVNPSHIVDGKIVPDEKLTISDEKFAELSAYHLKVGDVVMGRRGEMGRCAAVEQSGLLCGTGSLLIRTNGDLSADYIQQIISFPSFKRTIEDMAVGQTMPNLNVPIVSAFQIIKPPKSVQEQYYASIAHVDQSKSAIQKALDETQLLFDSLMQKFFG